MGNYLFSEGWHYGAVFFAAVMSVIVIINYQNRKAKLSSLQLSLEEMKNRKRNFKTISKLFNYDKNTHEGKNVVIDDQTWGDLEMDSFYKEVDFTLTTPGEQKLYEMLRMPLTSAVEIGKRGRIIEFFQKDEDSREKIRKALALLGRQHEGDIAEFIYESEHKYMSKFIFDILAFLLLLSGGLIFLYGNKAVFAFMLMFIINMSVHKRINKKINERVLSINYLSSIATFVTSFCKFDMEELKEYREELLRNKKTCDTILENSSSIGRTEGLDVIGDYINIMLLVQVRSYYKVMNKIEKSQKNLKSIYNIIGEIDALISTSVYKNTLDYYAAPQFTKDGRFRLREAVNPLIIGGVPNSIEINSKGIILTGSNMSGKSTFLRTIGINAITAQTLDFVTAEEYESDILEIVSSISPRDDISQGKSYYLGEAEAVLRIINKVKGNIRCLCIIDEIFRGTNPAERIAASAEILNYIMKHNAYAIVATHDLELTELTSDCYVPYYFSEEVDDAEGISFDYKLKKGVSPTRNAIKLLKYLGYPEEIIKNSQKRLVN
ncbi:MutS-related protein [Clostridium polynesiense]|uniref:MutS-related protein n=1 Tax=Clostridium polynesiense TaxID=1325933 RepID=UPI0006938B90|nr:hypothetical protein [Clostridium polynesiense]